MRSALPHAPKRIIVRDSKIDNIKLYDTDNRYPQRIYDIINASGTAKRSVETYAKYIIGSGFKDQLFYQAVVNKKGVTTDKLLKDTAKNYAHLGGRSYHVNYNGLLQVCEVSHIPYEYCRIGVKEREDMIAVYDDWECLIHPRIQTDKVKWYYRFTNDHSQTLAQIDKCGGIINFEGQIYCDSKYPLAPIDPVIEDAISDKGIKKFTQKEIDNGFNPSAVARFTKGFDGDEGRKEWEELQDTWKTFQGPDNAGKMVMLAGFEKDDFSLDRMGDPGVDKMYDATSNRVKQSIIQRFGQPPSLLGRRDGNAVFSSQNIEDDTKFYNSITTEERLLFEQDMKLLFSNFWLKINETDDYSILELTFGAVSSEVPSLLDKIGIDGVNAITSLLEQKTETNLPNDQKIQLLQIGYGLTLAQAQALVLGINVK